MIKIFELTQPERDLLIKILEYAKKDENDELFLSFIKENIDKLKRVEFDREVYDWFNGFFDENSQPKDIAENPEEIKIAKGLLQKFGVGAGILIQAVCPRCMEMVTIINPKNIIREGRRKFIKGLCEKCGKLVFHSTENIKELRILKKKGIKASFDE